MARAAFGDDLWFVAWWGGTTWWGEMIREGRERLSKGIEVLPVLPTVVTRLLSLDVDAAAAFEELIAVLEGEPTYALRVMGAANSLTTRGVEPIVRLREAVLRVGVRETVSLIVAVSVMRVFVPRTEQHRALWIHSLQVAAVSRALARHADLGLDAERAHLSGLLHDIGHFVMFDAAPELVKEVEASSFAGPEQLISCERATCGVDHTIVGADVCEKWRVPEPFVSVVRLHHEPNLEALLPRPEGQLACLVQAADATAYSTSTRSSASPEFGARHAAEREAALWKVLPAWYPRRPGLGARVAEALTRVEQLILRLGLRAQPRERPRRSA